MVDGNAADGWLARADRLGQWCENALLTLVLGAMILLASGQIGLRNLLGTGLPWADEALRLMVLWVAMLGAVAASREDRHISIDVLSRLLPPRWHDLVKGVVHAFTCAVAALVAWYALEFVRESRSFEDTLLDGLPAWWFQLILPLGFALIAYRYGIWALRAVRRLFQRRSA